MIMADCKNIEDYFRGDSMPKEVLEYTQLHRDVVLTFSEYHSYWCWKAFTAMLGRIQITAGVLIMVYGSLLLGYLAYHFGAGLNSEGAEDIIFAFQK